MMPMRAIQRGAALLVAMVILTLVSTLAAGMVWQQHRAVQVEGAERARTQAAWVLTGALDWGRLVLREDARTPGGADHLGEIWATPLAESRLSSFLAADRDNSSDSGLEAFLSGGIRDAQSRYNLRNLVAQGKVVEAELAALKRLCETAAVPPQAAELIATGLLAAWKDGEVSATTPLAPHTVDQLVWLGIDAASVQRLQPFIELLPLPTPLNINTAAPEVLAGVISGLDASSAERMVQARQRQPFKALEEARAYIQGDAPLDGKRIAVASRYFEISGRFRLEDRILEERSLVERNGQEVKLILRERHSAQVELR